MRRPEDARRPQCTPRKDTEGLRGAAVSTVNTPPWPSAPITPSQPPFAAGRGYGTWETNHENVQPEGQGPDRMGANPSINAKGGETKGPSEEEGLQGLGFSRRSKPW